jgi:RNA polymerase sigma-70 factor (ECF subfamily)
MSSVPSSELLAAARGDDAALSQLIQAYHKRVYRFGLRVCRSPQDAEDAVQEAFIKLMRRPDVVGHPSALSWLFSVVRFLCLLPLRPLLYLLPRSRWSDSAVEDDERAASAELDPEQALQRWLLVRAVHSAISDLEPAYREVLVLRDIEGLSGEETCRVLGIESASMKTRLHRARAKLREALAPDPSNARAGQVR